ncbi:hypothetical protein WN48_08127 [Eufriesea mexicana]|uniref:Chitin-binding type-2 domain-containing protein n=1 Tax=Eufriesea mexicana TaxID=516756 RepID=A0A310S878_9HYME|nr:hypothetical protein WN48_08127 [Eufriesea mexicana]
MIRQTYLIVLLSVIFAIVWSLPQQPKSRRPVPEFKNKTGGLELPDNATLIRENIVDNFSCQDRIYGYYADMENDCQVFHVCMPQARGATRWSFICPAETVFNQASVWHWCLPNGRMFSFLCPNGTVFSQSARVCDWWFKVDCNDSPRLYGINDDLYRDVNGNKI